jgi:hypothetical protein
VGGKPAGQADDARYFLAWIDRLAEAVQQRERIPDERSRAEVRAELDAAREVYRKIAEPRK